MTAESAGKIINVTGDVRAINGDEVRSLAIGDEIRSGDALTTGPDSAVEVEFLDGTKLSQGPDAEFTIDSYAFDPDKPDSNGFLFDLTQGTYRMVTGQIADDNPDGVQVKSPLATMGIRGTTTLHQVNPDGTEQHGAEEITGGRSIILTDTTGRSVVISFPMAMVDMAPGETMSEVRVISPDELDRFVSAITSVLPELPDTTGQDGDEPDEGDDAPDGGGKDGAEGGEGDDGGEGGDGGEDGDGDGGEVLLEVDGEELVDALEDLEEIEITDLDDLLKALKEITVVTNTPPIGPPVAEPLDPELEDSDPVTPTTQPAHVLKGTEDGDSLAIEGDDTAYDWTIYGYGGNDTVFAAAGDDTVYGGAGQDCISGEQGDDCIMGGDGNDMLFGGDEYDLTVTGHDTIFGEAGNDAIAAGNSSALLYGGDGNDTIVGLDGNDTIDGGDDADTLFGGSGNDCILGGDGNDYIHSFNMSGRAETGSDLLFGGAGNDSMAGDDGNDLMAGGDGDDVLNGGGGIDTLSFADATNGVQVSTASSNVSVSNDGFGDSDSASNFEWILGSSHGDEFTVRMGALGIDGGEGMDTLIIEDTLSACSTSNGVLTLNGGESTYQTANVEVLVINGTDNSGADLVDLTGLGDVDNGVYTNSGDDTIGTGAGSDTIDAGSGSNIIDGGAGRDYINAGSGNNAIIINETSPTAFDIVENFASGSDKLIVNINALGANAILGNPLNGTPMMMPSGTTGDGGGNPFFRRVASTGAITGNHSQFYYVTAGTKKGLLIYDTNGTGAGGQATVAQVLGTNGGASDLDNCDILLFSGTLDLGGDAGP